MADINESDTNKDFTQVKQTLERSTVNGNVIGVQNNYSKTEPILGCSMKSLKGISIDDFTKEKYDKYIESLNSFMFSVKRGGEKKEFAKEILQEESKLCEQAIKYLSEHCKKEKESFNKENIAFKERVERRNRNDIKDGLMSIGWNEAEIAENNIIQTIIDSDNTATIKKLHAKREQNNKTCLLYQQWLKYDFFLKEEIAELGKIQDVQAMKNDMQKAHNELKDTL